VSCLHSENETCTLGLLTSFSTYIQTNHLTTFNYTYVATRTPNSRRVNLETSSSSSVGPTARRGFWPVEQYLSIFSYPPSTLSIFSIPALEDLFLLNSTQYFKSWKTPCSYQNIYLVLFRPTSLNLSSLFLCSTFVIISFFTVWGC